MKSDIYIANTDHDWFGFCQDHSPLSEVNFWQPSRQHFRALDEGGVFFFRRKAPINKVGGFGVFVSAGTASIGTAWRDLGISNGLETLDAFVEKVRKYKSSDFVDEDTLIGFKLLTEPVFLDEEDYFALPSDWSPNIVTGKGYSSDSDAGRELYWNFVRLREKYSHRDRASAASGFSEPPASGFGATTQKTRIGQSAFRMAVIGAYEGKCAVTGTTVEKALEAAHLLDFAKEPDHATNNGILLRKDIHALFDAKFLLIDRDYKIRFSESFKERHPNSSEYLEFEGKKISLPRSKNSWPSLDKLYVAGHLFTKAG